MHSSLSLLGKVQDCMILKRESVLYTSFSEGGLVAFVIEFVAFLKHRDLFAHKVEKELMLFQTDLCFLSCVHLVFVIYFVCG